MASVKLSEPVVAALARVGQVDVAVGLLTYNNAETLDGVLGVATEGLARHFSTLKAALVVSDAGSSDATRERAAAAGLPTIVAEHKAPAGERVAVPFHGVPGRSSGLRTIFEIAHRLGVRVLVLLEADMVSASADWIQKLAIPVLDGKADFVTPVYARHRYEGTISRLLLNPLLRALFGRRLHQPLGGQQALSARLVEHLLINPKWSG